MARESSLTHPPGAPADAPGWDALLARAGPSIPPRVDMFGNLYKRVAQLILFVLVGMLSLVMLQFGGPTQWTAEGTQRLASVYGQRIAPGELRAAFLLAGGENYPAELVERYQLEPMLLFGLVERSLLAREARALGMDVTEEEVLQRVALDGTIYVSMSVDADPALPRSGAIRYRFDDSDGKFSKTNLKNFIEYRLRQPVSDFAQSQIDETLAHRMRETVTANVTVAPGEVWDAYVRENEAVTLAYARFSPVYYGKEIQPSEAELTAWMAKNAADVDAEYEKQKHRYTGLEKQVRARHVLIKAAQDASEDEKAAAREKAESVRARALAGEDFATLARELSEDTGSAVRGGDLGFNPKGRMVPPFDEAQFALEPGAVSDVVETQFGFHVIEVEAIREGDVPVDEAKRELAEQLYRQREAGARAEADARALHAKLRGGMAPEEVDAFLQAQAALKAQAAAPATPTDPEAGDTEVAAPTPAPDPLAPAWRKTPPFGRGDTAIPGPFDSRPLVKLAYTLTADAPVPAEPVQLGDDWFVVRLDKREDADRAAFSEDDQRRIREALLARRRVDALGDYVRSLRSAAEQAGDVSVDFGLLASRGSTGTP